MSLNFLAKYFNDRGIYENYLIYCASKNFINCGDDFGITWKSIEKN